MDVEGGVRTQCLAICERGDEQDFSVKGKRVTATGDGVAFEFDELFESHEYDPESLFESLLGPTEVSDFSLSPASSPLVRFVEDVQPLCILLLGSKSTQRREAFQGVNNSGLIGWASDRVIQMLEKKEDLSPSFTSEISVSMIEIYDEVIQDLLQPNSQNLDIQLDPGMGFVVKGADRRRVKTHQEIEDIIQNAKDNCNTASFPTGNASETRSAIFDLKIQQSDTGTAGSGPQHGTARLLIVDLPSVHKLAMDEETVRAQDGTQLNRSLVTFRAVCEALSRKSEVHRAPFGQSKLSALLQVRKARCSTSPNLLTTCCPALGLPWGRLFGDLLEFSQTWRR